MAYPNDPFAAVSPFEDVTSPEEQFAIDMAKKSSPIDLAPDPGAIDVSPDAAPMGELPSIEQFEAAMYQPEGMQVEEGGLAPMPEWMQQGEPAPVAEEPLDDFQRQMIAGAPTSFGGLDPQYQTDTGFAPPVDRPETGVTADLGEYQQPSPDEYRDVLMEPEGFEPGAPPAAEDLTDRALMVQQWEADQAEEAKRRELEMQADSDDAQRQAENLKIREDAITKAKTQLEQIYADSKAISEKGVDNGRWWKSRSTGQKIAAYFSAAIGGQQGLMSGRGGNDAMDLIMGEIDKDIASQKFDIQNQRAGLKEQKGIVGEIYALTGDMFQAEETARLAARQGVSAQISNQIAMMDPEGTSARQLEMKKRAWDSQTNANAAATAQASRNQAIKEGEYNIKVREQDRKDRKTAADMAKMEADARAKARKGRGGGRKMTPEYISKVYGLDVPVPMNQKQLDRHMATIGKVQKLTGTTPKGPQSPQEQLAQIQLDERDEERVRTLGFGGMKRRDRTPLLAASPTQAAEMGLVKSATDDATELIDEMIMIRETKGGEYFKTSKGRTLASKHAQLLSKLAGVEGWGALSEGDLELGRNFTTTSDPNEYRKYKTAMLGLRQDLVDKANNRFKSIGDGEAAHYEPKRKTRKTEHERTVGERLSSISEGLPEAAKTDPELREGLISKRAQDALDIADSYSPEYGDTRSVGETVNQQLAAGEYTPEEAKRIVVPMAKRMRDQFKATMEGKSVEELLELQNDPEFMREVEILSRAKKSHTDEDLYELVTGAALGAEKAKPAQRPVGRGGHKALSPEMQRALEVFK